MSRSLWLGVLIAPLAAPFSCAIALMILSGGGLKMNEALGVLFLTFSTGVPVSYAVSILLGLPTILFLRRNQTLTGGTCLFAGSITGALVALLPIALPWSGEIRTANEVAGVAAWVAAGAGLGLSVATAFCVITKLPIRVGVPGPTTSG